MPGSKFLKIGSRMPPRGLQRADQWQFQVVMTGQEFGDGHGGLHLRKPGRPALFNGFNGDLLPFFALLFGAFAIQLRDHALGMMLSMILPRGSPTSRVTGQGGAAVERFSLIASVRPWREASTTSPMNSWPAPSRTDACSPDFKRSTCNA